MRSAVSCDRVGSFLLSSIHKVSTPGEDLARSNEVCADQRAGRLDDVIRVRAQTA